VRRTTVAVVTNTDAHPLPMLTPDAALAAARAAGLPDGLAAPHVFRFGLRNPKVGALLAGVVDMAVLDGTLDARLREIAILRTGWRIGSIYEWSNHVPIALRAGMSEAEVVAVRDADAAVLTGADLLAIRVTDEVLDHVSVSPSTLVEAHALLDDDSLMELVAIPAAYRLIGSMLLTFDVPLEAHVAPWAPDGVAPAT
jgi:alkylhydroperoxidase family enzyme